MKKKTKAKAAAKKQHPSSDRLRGSLRSGDIKEAEAVSAPKVADYERKRTELEVAKLKVAPWNPRPKITPESVADLAESIKSLGVIEPLVAMMDADGCAVLLSGHRRLAAAKLAGLEKVPYDILLGIDEPTAKRMTFIANLQRKDADPLLESELVGSLVKSGMTQDEIAAETGRGREWVARRLNLSRLSKSWRKRVKDGEQITTDCLEHVAAYPEEVQEKLKGARNYNYSGVATRWCDIEGQFSRETQDLKTAVFDRTPCKACPDNTGCTPDLFGWDGKPTVFGKCMNAKCYRRKVAEAIKAAIADAKANGVEVREGKQHPDYSISLQAKPDKRHSTLYVWEDYNGETVMKWGEKPRGAAKSGGGLTEEEKELRRIKIAANKARRKLAEWCRDNLAGLIAKYFPMGYAVARAFQDAFSIGSSWRVIGSKTGTAEAAWSYLLMPETNNALDPAKWAKSIADEIVAKLTGAMGVSTGEKVCAMFAEAYAALTEEERSLVVGAEKLESLRKPPAIEWVMDGGGGDAEAEDDEEPFDDEEV